jgi:hypothetical protein
VIKKCKYCSGVIMLLCFIQKPDCMKYENVEFQDSAEASDPASASVAIQKLRLRLHAIPLSVHLYHTLYSLTLLNCPYILTVRFTSLNMKVQDVHLPTQNYSIRSIDKDEINI